MHNSIYSYIEENFKIKIQDYIFKRDYIKDPLKKIKTNTPTGYYYEEPNIEDLKYMYLTLNLKQSNLMQIFKVSLAPIVSWTKKYHIQKDRKTIGKRIALSMQEKYGDNNPTYVHSSEFKQRMKEKYGVENAQQSSIIHNKTKNTNIKRYGVENVQCLKDIREKIKQTNIKKYGVENVGSLQSTREKMYATSIERYGVGHFVQSSQYKDLYKDKEFLNKKMSKDYQTRKNNNSFNISHKEDEIYQKLISKFNDVKRQYKSDLYPFRCDFYIPSIDTYIEYQGWWGHGKEPYVGNEEQKKIINIWYDKSKQLNFQNKIKQQYINAINVWTIRDPLKRQTAKDNGLKWLEFFNMKDFYNWLDEIFN